MLKQLFAGAVLAGCVTSASFPVQASVLSGNQTAPALNLNRLDTTRRVPEGRSTQVTVEVNHPIGYEVTSTSIIARRAGKTLRGRHNLRLPTGRWRVERAATVRTEARTVYHPAIPGTDPVKLSQAIQNPSAGQCTIAAIGTFNPPASPAVVGQVTIACDKDGVVLTGVATPFHIGVALVPEKATIGRDIADWASDPPSYFPDSPVKTLSGVYWMVSGVKPGTPATPAREEVIPAGRDIHLRSRDVVKVTEYNPGCVSGSEYRRLRMTMSRGQWHHIVGGTGYFESRVAGGYETRSYLGCTWSGPDLSIVYQDGQVVAWQVV